MTPALGNVVNQYGQNGYKVQEEIARRARSRAELFMFEDHRNSLKTNPQSDGNCVDWWEELGYGRGYRDAMVEVMTWVTGRDSDEILSELHDQIVGAA
jgi:hypothetical protein